MERIDNQQNKAIIEQAEIHYRNEYFDARNPHPGETLLKTLDYCFQAGIDIPEWAKTAYRKCYIEYGKTKSESPLVKAFSTDPNAGKERESKLRKQQHLNTVCHTVLHLYWNEGFKKDDDLWEETAQRIGVPYIGPSTVKLWFYSDIKPMVDILGKFPLLPQLIKPKK